MDFIRKTAGGQTLKLMTKKGGAVYFPKLLLKITAFFEGTNVNGQLLWIPDRLDRI